MNSVVGLTLVIFCSVGYVPPLRTKLDFAELVAQPVKVHINVKCESVTLSAITECCDGSTHCLYEQTLTIFNYLYILTTEKATL